MGKQQSEYDLNIIRLKEELKYIDSEINYIKNELSNLSNELRWKYIRRQDILSALGYGNAE